MPGSVAIAIELTDEERAQLEAWARRRTSAQALAQRSRVVLWAAEGLSNSGSPVGLGVKRRPEGSRSALVCGALVG